MKINFDKLTRLISANWPKHPRVATNCFIIAQSDLYTIELRITRNSASTVEQGTILKRDECITDIPGTPILKPARPNAHRTTA